MINVAVVGYGYWGANLVRNFVENRNCKVVSICEIDEKKWPALGRKYPQIFLTKFYNDLLDNPEINAIVIATPVSTHYELSRQALEKKKDIFVEKPLTTKSFQVQELISVANENKCILFVDHTFEYSPAVIKIKEIIDSGELGEILYISTSRINLGLHQSDISVICDLAPHDLSIIFFWLNEEPIEISAVGKGFIRKSIPDISFIKMRFVSGIVANLLLSWLSPIKLRRTVVVGSKKMIVYDDTEMMEKIKIYDKGVIVNEPNNLNLSKFRLTYKTGGITIPVIETSEPLSIAVNHFIECVKTRKTPKTDGRNALRIANALELAEKSLHTGVGGIFKKC